MYGKYEAFHCMYLLCSPYRSWGYKLDTVTHLIIHFSYRHDTYQELYKLTWCLTRYHLILGRVSEQHDTVPGCLFQIQLPPLHSNPTYIAQIKPRVDITWFWGLAPPSVVSSGCFYHAGINYPFQTIRKFGEVYTEWFSQRGGSSLITRLPSVVASHWASGPFSVQWVS